MKGLLLVGGKSSRMGTDKAALILRDGISQRERGLELLGKVCDQVFLSTSSDSGEPNTIPDTFGNLLQLTDLSLSYNPGLTGQIPNTLGSLSKLTSLDMTQCVTPLPLCRPL